MSDTSQETRSASSDIGHNRPPVTPELAFEDATLLIDHCDKNISFALMAMSLASQRPAPDTEEERTLKRAKLQEIVDSIESYKRIRNAVLAAGGERPEPQED